jgi:hypothetical protein
MEVLCSRAPFSRSEIADIVATASRRYKTFKVLKRQGQGHRTIAQPSAEVKLLQRVVLDEIVGYWPVHSAAVGYRRGKSILNHARLHAASRFLLKLDFKDFFPSITASDVRQHAQSQARPRLTEEDLQVLTRILCWRNKQTGSFCLSIGAPSSPACSNALLFDFDAALSEECRRRGVTYSRYADDLAFSCMTPKTLHEIEQITRALLLDLRYPRLRLNDRKTVNVSKRHRRTLVGLVLSAQGEVSLGRERKRTIRAMVHAFTLGKLNVEEVNSLRGMLAYAWSIEPAFIDSLMRAYGPEHLMLLQLPI